MGNTPTDPEGQNQLLGHPSGSERIVYLIPEQPPGAGLREISLRELWDLLFARKWLIIAVTGLFAVASVLFALAQTHWYRVDVVLAPAADSAVPAIGGQLGGLAALAGVNVRGRGNAESLAVLRSQEFARSFIEDHDLMPVLFAEQWDAERGEWKTDGTDGAPDLRDGAKLFREKLLTVQEERTGGIVKVSVEWTDPETAAAWADLIVHRLNARMRDRALQEAETNVAYLREELAQTSLVTLQESIGRLLENELQKLMMARGNEDFAFIVIDNAFPPKDRVRPKRTLIVLIGTLLGGMIAVFGVLIHHALRDGAAAAGLPNSTRDSA